MSAGNIELRQNFISFSRISKEIVMNLEIILLETIYFWLRLEKSRNAEHVPSLLTASVTKKWKIISSGSNPNIKTIPTRLQLSSSWKNLILILI